MKSKRISLRIHRSDADDLRQYHALFSNEDVMKYVIFPIHKSISQSKEKLLELLNNDNETLFAVIDKESTDYIGLCGISTNAESDVGEIGYMLFPKYWHKGFASEIAALLIAYGFETLHLTKIVAACDIRNQASEKIMQKCGMTKEAHTANSREIDGELSDGVRYAINRIA